MSSLYSRVSSTTWPKDRSMRNNDFVVDLMNSMGNDSHGSKTICLLINRVSTDVTFQVFMAVWI
jgi:hypothetical protein